MSRAPGEADFPLRMGRAMVAQRVSFRMLASQTGLSPGYLCQLAGGRRRPSVAALERIVAVLELPRAD